jgi:hypothetical protein
MVQTDSNLLIITKQTQSSKRAAKPKANEGRLVCASCFVLFSVLGVPTLTTLTSNAACFDCLASMLARCRPVERATRNRAQQQPGDQLRD